MSAEETRLDTPEELRLEIRRLTDLVEAANTAENKVVRIGIKSNSFPPTLVITAPGMNEREIASYLYDFYTLLFESFKVVSRDNDKAIFGARKVYRECADVAEKYGHAPCAAELRRRAETVGAQDEKESAQQEL